MGCQDFEAIAHILKLGAFCNVLWIPEVKFGRNLVLKLQAFNGCMRNKIASHRIQVDPKKTPAATDSKKFLGSP